MVTVISLALPLQAVEPKETCSAPFWSGGATVSEVALTGLHVPSRLPAELAICSLTLAAPLGGKVTTVRGVAGFCLAGSPIVVAGVPPACETVG